MNKQVILIVVLSLMFCNMLFAQADTDNNNETVSMRADTYINAAAQILEHFSMEESGKKLINLSQYNGSINVQISDMNWRKALELIVLQNALMIEEGIGYIAIKDIDEDRALEPEAVEQEVEINPEMLELQKEAQVKQVRIKAVAMLADRSYLKSLGIDWSTVLNGKVTVNAGFSGASQLTSPLTLSGSGTTDIGSNSIDINTLIRTIESDQRGSILAEPSILVSSGKTGRIQVGQDISIKSADEAGNTIDTFFSTGIIMTVTPTIVELEGEDLIMMELAIERSSGQPSAISTVIAKSSSATELILYDQEEAVIAGLFDTDETVVRSGVPILKDLPWWVFGIRYLTGYDSVDKKERELIITIKAEIMDTALERLHRARNQESAALD
jgi:general secretion pathway protein D